MPKERGIEKQVRKKVEKIQHQKEEFQILDYTILTKPRTIFISSLYNYSSKPSTIVTSLFKFKLVLSPILYKFIV